MQVTHYCMNIFNRIIFCEPNDTCWPQSLFSVYDIMDTLWVLFPPAPEAKYWFCTLRPLWYQYVYNWCIQPSISNIAILYITTPIIPWHLTYHPQISCSVSCYGTSPAEHLAAPSDTANPRPLTHGSCKDRLSPRPYWVCVCVCVCLLLTGRRFSAGQK